MLEEKRLYKCTCASRKELYSLYIVDVKEFCLCAKCKELFDSAKINVEAHGWRALRRAGLTVTGLTQIKDLHEAKLASALFKEHPGVVLHTYASSQYQWSFPLWMQDLDYHAVFPSGLHKLPDYFSKTDVEYHLLLSIGLEAKDDEKDSALKIKEFPSLRIGEQDIFGYKVKFSPLEKYPYGHWLKTRNPVEKIPLQALELLIDNASLEYPNILELIAGEQATIIDDDVLL